MKHTQGKWTVENSGNPYFDICIAAEDGGSICHITKWPEQKANAKLIAAAPETKKQRDKLLEALKELVDHKNVPNWTKAEQLIKNTEK